MFNLNNFKRNLLKPYELDSNSSRGNKIMLVNVSTSSLKKKSTCGQISLVFHRQYSFAVFKRLELYFKTIWCIQY